jgi:hypothetical protein
LEKKEENQERAAPTKNIVPIVNNGTFQGNLILG